METKVMGITFLIFAYAFSLRAQLPIGIWKTIDDNSGNAISKIQIYEKNGMFFGKIIDLLQDSNKALCEKCAGNKKNKKIVGLVIIENLYPYKDYWKNGQILDPETGNTYGCSIWFEEKKINELKVRGKHWTGFFRTQTWYRVK